MYGAENTNEDILRQCLQDPKGYILDSLFARNALTLEEKRRIAKFSAEERGAELGN